MRTLCKRRVVINSLSTKQRSHLYKCQPALALPLLPHWMPVLQSAAVYVLQVAQTVTYFYQLPQYRQHSGPTIHRERSHCD